MASLSEITVDVRVMVDGRAVSVEHLKELATVAMRLGIPVRILGDYEADVLFGDGSKEPVGVLSAIDVSPHASSIVRHCDTVLAIAARLKERLAD